MRRPGLWTLCGLALAAAGFAAMSYAASTRIGLPIWDPTVKTAEATGFVGGLAALGGLILALLNYVRYRKHRRLEQGKDLVAGWRVSPSEMAAFLHRDIARAALCPSLRNKVRFDETASREGIGIRIGDNAMIVDGSSYWLGIGFMNLDGPLVDAAWIEGPPAMIEFTLHVRRKHDSWIEVLRIPVPEAARADGLHAVSHLGRATSPHVRQKMWETFPDHFRAAKPAAAPA